MAQLRQASDRIAAAAEGCRYHQQLQGQDLVLASGSSSRTALTHTLAPTSWHVLGIWSGSTAMQEKDRDEAGSNSNPSGAVSSSNQQQQLNKGTLEMQYWRPSDHQKHG